MVDVVEMVDMLDCGSSAHVEFAGSSPVVHPIKK